MDGAENYDFMLRSLRRLRGRTVVHVRTTAPAWDVRITFDDSTELVLLCDQAVKERDSSYSVRLENRVFIVSSGLLTFEEARPSLAAADR